MKIERFLVVRADGDVRVVARRPRLRPDEVAYRLNVTIPPAWGRLAEGAISIDLPEPPPVPDVPALLEAEPADG